MIAPCPRPNSRQADFRQADFRPSDLRQPGHDPSTYVCVLILEDASGMRSYKLDRATYSIGRSIEASIQIQGKTCSRKHATLVQAQGRLGSIQVPDGPRRGLMSYKLFDGDLATHRPSANGTLVNGYPIEAHVLRHEDVIWLGSEVKATFLQVSRDLIPDSRRDFQTLVIQAHFSAQRRQVCYVDPSGTTLVAQDRQGDNAPPVQHRPAPHQAVSAISAP